MGTPLVGHYKYVNSVCVSPDSRCILSASADQTVRLKDLNFQQQLGDPLKFEDYVKHVSLSGDNHTVLSVCYNGAVSLRVMRSRKVALKFMFVGKILVLYSSSVSVSFEKDFS